MDRSLPGPQIVNNDVAILFRIFDCLIKHTVLIRIALAVRQMSGILTSGNEFHATIYQVRIIDGQPNRNGF